MMRKSPVLESQNSFERIRQLVEREGKSARNLVAWSVPAVEQSQRSHGKVRARRRPARSSGLSRSERMCMAAAGQYSGTQRGSGEVGKTAKVDVHARYWSYLFDHLFRAVDEIYRTCEVDNSIIECQEVMMTLEACRRDFEALIRRIEMEKSLESSSQGRPPGVAWEVRKTTSPSKLVKPHPKPHPPFPSKGSSDQPHPPSPSKGSSDQPHPPFPSKGGCDQPHPPSPSKGSSDQPHPPSPSKGSSDQPPHTGLVRSLQLSGTSQALTWADRVRGVGKASVQGSGGRAQREEGRAERSECGGGNSSGTAAESRSEDCQAIRQVGGRDESTGEERTGEEESVEGRGEGAGEEGILQRRREDHREGRGEEEKREEGGEGDGGEERRRGEESGREGRGVEMEEGEKQIPNERSMEAEGQGQDGGGEETFGEGTQKEGASAGAAVEAVTEERAIVQEGNTPCASHKEEEEEDAEESSWSRMVREFNETEGCHRVSWADRCDSPPPDFLPDTPRSPGRAITLHQRLSSPSRKRPIEESKRILEEKQAKAQQVRDRLQEEQRLRSKLELEKVREARETRESRVRQWRREMEVRLQRADMLRESHLQEKVRKAQEEDAKVSEIAFINTLEAQNRKIQVLQRHQGHEARLADRAEERQRKKEELAAREEAAQERRRALEAERKAKLLELDQRRKEQDAKIEQKRQVREKAREEAAQEKARVRERRLEARNTALMLSTEELGRKIQMKQDESSRRHDQLLEQIKEKAASRHTSSEDAPCVAPYQHRKWCTLCNVPIISEVYLQSHERGRRHQEALAGLGPDYAPVIVEMEEDSEDRQSSSEDVAEQLRAGKKRARKLRQRMTARWREQEVKWQQSAPAQSPHRQKLQRCVKEVAKVCDRCSPKSFLDKAQLQLLDRSLGEMGRLLSGRASADQLCFCQVGGVAVVTRLLLLCTGPAGRPVPARSVLLAVNVLQAACSGHALNCQYLVASNKFTPLLDLLLPLLEDRCREAELCAAIFGILGTTVSTLSISPTPSLLPTLTDCVSYLVCVGVVDQISEYLGTVSGPIQDPPQAQLVISAVNVMVAISAALHARVDDVFSVKKSDPTSLTSALQDTELLGLFRLLYAMLLHDGPPRHSSIPPILPPHTLSISTAALKAINNFAILDLRMVQSCLGAEGISLEFRHVASYLLWHCTHHEHSALLQELILAVGYFSVLNSDNQVFLQAGRSPTLLQLLCNLPFQYFSNPSLSSVLYPTLIAACHGCVDNRAILEQEVSCQLLTSFLRSQLSQTRQTSGNKDLLAFACRFPRDCWQDSLEFFSN